MAVLDDALSDLRQTVAALERQLEERTAERDNALARQTATSEILSVISRSPTDVQPVFEAIVACAARVCEAEFSAVARFADGLLHLVALNNMSSEETAAFHSLFPRPPGRHFVMGRAFVDAQPVHFDDVLTWLDYDPHTVQVLQSVSGYRSFVAVPIFRDSRPIGVIGCGRREVKPFTATQIDLVKTFADQAAIALENVRLFSELEALNRDLAEALDQQTATAEVLGVINSSPGDLAPVFDVILEKAHRLCAADTGTIAVREGEVYRRVSSTFAAAEPEHWANMRQRAIVPGRDSMAGRVLLEGRVVHVADIRADPDYALPEAVAAGQRTILGVPLLREGAVLGTINLVRKQVEPFTERQIALVTTFADQAVIAMENARLLGELQARTRDLEESLEYQTATSDVLSVISRSTSDVQPVLDTVVETAARLCEAEMVLIHRRDGEVYRLAVSLGFPPEFPAFLKIHPITPTRGSIAGRVALEGCLVQIADCASDPEYGLSEAVEVARQRTALGVPLLRENAPIGIVVLARTRVEPFTERQIALVTTFADQAVIAMENARLLGELQARTRDLEESLEYQTATSDVLKVISRSTFDLQPVLDTLVETAARLCAADLGLLSSREGEAYRVAATFSTSPEYEAFIRGRLLPGDRGSMAGRAALTGQVVQVADLAVDPEFTVTETVTVGKMRTAIGVPLLREGVVVGVLSLARGRVEPFTERQIELVRTFADQAVIAIENTRLITETREALEQQTATAEVLQVINSSPGDLGPVFDAMLEKAMRLCEAAFGF